jgi:hypothetical protein
VTESTVTVWMRLVKRLSRVVVKRDVRRRHAPAQRVQERMVNVLGS